MTTTPTTALVMRSNAAARHATATTLRELGLAVVPFGDESHLYAQTIRLAIAPGAIRRPMVIVTEPTDDVVRDLAMLRSGSWRVPIVLVGRNATDDLGRRLGAACLPEEQPGCEAFERAMREARRAAGRRATPARAQPHVQPRFVA